ncbi:hypothetical protein BDW59DRAFT_147654 [Aspergillus cavernicola]|uniref:Zn(2)-C6 fungal-type domain-containing protein n=1 Tax=Aspergillus cavernicola TaxID=176166 RepID=A0ABR4I8Z0_9EURO
MSSIVDGRVAKLRASCDACNESKVRCSQKKPRCTRCEKHDLLCVYGLSRRSHKNAPRIGASQEASHTAPPSPPSDTTALPPPMSPNTVNNDARAHSVSQNDLVSADEHELLASSIQSPGSRLYADELGLAFNQLTEFSLPPESTSHDFLNFALTSPHVHDSSGFIHYDFPIERGQPDGAACNCVSRLITELASLPSVSGASFDAQLSQLRRIINVSEGCISCNCTSQDEMSISTPPVNRALCSY